MKRCSCGNLILENEKVCEDCRYVSKQEAEAITLREYK
jgi:hypothetical protein